MDTASKESTEIDDCVICVEVPAFLVTHRLGIEVLCEVLCVCPYTDPYILP